jgi:hypothetical protein
MLFLAAILIGVVIGFLCGGRLSHLARLRLRWLWLVPISLVIQLLIFPLFSEAPLFPYATVPLHLFSYALVGLWLIVNLRMIPLVVTGVGALANFLAVAANGGRMPASVSALQRAGLEHAATQLGQHGVYANGILMGDGTRFNVLGDWLYLPGWMPFATALSLGDVLIMVGLVWLIARGMVAND